MNPCPDPAAHTDPVPKGDDDAGEVGRLRATLADEARARLRVPASDRVDAALRTVARHEFLPGVPLTEAYSLRPIVTRHGSDGASTSSASAPVLVAEMLAIAEIEPGHHVLEVGAATGFNAALLAELAGPDGQVTTVELDDDLAAGARTALVRAGYPRVTVITGDGARGASCEALFDRIVVTAAAGDLPHAWWRQLAPDGRVVMPLALHPSGLTRIVALQRDVLDRLVSDTVLVGGFVPMRSPADDGADESSTVVDLSDGAALALGVCDHTDHAAEGQACDQALADVLRHPAAQRWTGITTRDDDPVEHLALWLLAHTDERFARIQASAAARAAGHADPARRWAGAAVHDGHGTLAYLTARDVDQNIEELGVTAHGPHAALRDRLADHLVALLRRWDAHHRPNTPHITLTRSTLDPDSTDLSPDPVGRPLVVRRRVCRIEVTWSASSPRPHADRPGPLL